MAAQTGGEPLIEKAEEDPCNLPYWTASRGSVKADVDWLVLWFNLKFEAWTPLRPDS
jgi:hypothetical protein